MAHPIFCKYCDRSIRSRQTLAVMGRTLEPLHTSCYAAYAAQQPWYRRPGWPVNRWRSLLAFNTLLLLGIFLLHLFVGPLAGPMGLGLRPLLVVINAWLLLARLISYWSIEQHLPRQGRNGGTPSR